ncbi:cylicin-1 [Sturnira hondurensis]|uniref:cylicin-1 n=1 Tax=Sturnira hondurensis TaxID=192404 RepID=UPI0018794F58|nr:cylicin-1 [Sturnira hondurensis]
MAQRSNSLLGCRQEVNIEAHDNTLQMSESSSKLCNQEYSTLTFPKPPQPGRKKRSRLSELHITVPRYEKRKLEEVHKPAQIWIRNFLRKKFQRPSNYFTVRRQALSSHPYTPKTHPEKPESEKSEDSKKNTGPHEKTPESKVIANDKKPRRGNKTSSKSSHESKLSRKLNYKSETNPESKDSKAVLMKDRRKRKRYFKNFEKTNIESICTQKDSKSSENNSDARSEACSKNSENIDLMVSLEESGAESMEFDMWLKNCSQNNSKKPSKKEASKSSDTDSVDSKGGKKGNKDKKKDKKKDAKKDTESTDESEASKDRKKGTKKTRRDMKKRDKKKESKKDTDSTDAESESESDAKKGKKILKNKKGSKKKDAKKDTESTDADPQSEKISKEGGKDAKMVRRMSIKFEKKKSAVKSQESSETESDLDTKRPKRGSKKQDTMKKIESTDTESDESSKKGPKKPGLIKSSDADSDDSMYKYWAKEEGVQESDATSTDSKKGVLGLKRDLKTSFRKTTFKEKEKAVRCRALPSRSPPLLATPCEPIILSPRIKHQCHCKRHSPPPKPRYAPLGISSSILLHPKSGYMRKLK